MVDSEGDSKKENSEEFDYRAELSTLVANNVLPAKIAERLEKRLTEKNVKINKEQLHTIANKINEILKNYKPGSKIPEPSKSDSEIKEKSEKTPEMSSNMNELLKNIEELQGRIENIEKDLSEFINPLTDETQEKDKQDDENTKKEKTPKLVTTEDIKIPDSYKNYEYKFEMDPLDKIPSDPESIVVLMKWLQHLIDKSGRIHLHEILDYYVDIGWISEEAKIVLMDYSNGITEESKKEGTAKKNVSELPSKDHIQSLLFINKLKGNKIDKHFLDRIEGDISKITKRLNSYNVG